MKFFLINLVILILFVVINGKTKKPSVGSCRYQNEEFRDCGCDQICNAEPQFCVAVCTPSCYCKKGFIRESSNSSSGCVPPSECPAVPQCQINEEYKECGTCEQYCNEKPAGCSAVCRPSGCYCKKGYVRPFRGSFNICIPPSYCPRSQEEYSSFIEKYGKTRKPSVGSCRYQNEEFRDCGCDQVCNAEPQFCAAVCTPSCYCKKGFIRESFNSSSGCVLPSKCPDMPPKNVCPENEEYKCGSFCPDSCDSYNKCCGEGCTFDCFCKDGFVREHDNTEDEKYPCIPRGQCPLCTGIY